MKVYPIEFVFDEAHKQPVTVQGVEGETLLEICEENHIDLHHNCGGVCACTTCHVYIEQGMENLPEMSEKEEDYVDRAINPRIESRLACQCAISGPVRVRVPDQSVTIGHQH